ncbi:MAG: PAS domain S-box protein [Acidobacteriota bacterium]|nr:PAS domain S-box protein [Acidobacteriota bacterium]
MDQALLDVVADPIFVKDRHHRLVQMNEAFCRFMGSTREKLLGQTGLELVTPEEAAVFVAKDDEVLQTGRESVSEEEATFGDGRSLVVVTRKTLYVNEKGERFVVGVIRDITERKRADKERERLVEDLRKALAEVRTLQEYLPICSYCRKVRDDKNYWTQIEIYVTEHTGSMFSHGICPECYAKVVQPQLDGIQRPSP